jgi:Phage holin T7 family, holin superfamily II
MKSEAAVAVSAAPPASVGGLLIMGVALADWVLICTALYTVLALFVLVRDKFYIPWRNSRGRK